MAFRVRPHFYQTAWFYALSVTALALMGYAGHRYRMRRLLEIVRVRMRIASDLHDDIGSTLSQIAILSEVARAQAAPGAEKAAEPIARIGALSRESLDSMADIVWAIDPQKDRLTHLSQRMRRLAADLAGASGIRFRFETVGDETDRPLGADLRREVFLVFKESLNNAVRHSRCTEVAIELRLESSRLVLTVADDGEGFDAGGEREGQGLRSMRRRAGSLGGTLGVVSREGGGTKVTLTVPYRGRAVGIV
jgi:signal transduction histidine kinase